MQKQKIYASAISRIVATSLDMIIFSIILSPITQSFNRIILMNSSLHLDSRSEKFKEDLMNQVFNGSAENFAIFIKCIIVINLFNLLLLGFVFVFLWHKYGTTPGKIFMRIKMQTINNHKPDIKSCVYRFIGYLISPVGFFMMFFNNRQQALHDIIANTEVIKI